jgi:hypothetical protein
MHGSQRHARPWFDNRVTFPDVRITPPVYVGLQLDLGPLESANSVRAVFDPLPPFREDASVAKYNEGSGTISAHAEEDGVVWT